MEDAIPLKAVALVCTLKRTPEKSSADKLAVSTN
jgi:hypothetical protein